MACGPHPAHKITHLMSIINDLSVCGSRIFSPVEHPCRYGWVFIFLWPCGKSHAKLCERRKRGRRSKTASVAGTGQVHRETGEPKLDASMSGKAKKLFPMMLETAQLSADCIKLGAG